MPPDRGLAETATAGVKGKKARLTYAFTANADGTEKRPAFIIGKWKKPRAFLGKTGQQLGFRYRNNATAWMTAKLYQEWLEEWDQECVARDRHILLLQDNFSGHIPPAILRNITIENFEPNLTSHVQPNDQGIIRCFKAYYRARFVERAIERYDSGITPSNIYDINQLEAMRLAEAAWQEVDTTTIRNCWRKAGILPDVTPPEVSQPLVPISSLINDGPSDNPVAQAEKELTDALDDLRRTGALQSANQMSIEALLNPAEEAVDADDISDDDILKAVRESKAADEAGEGPDDEPAVELPTRSEALQAAGVINRLLTTMDGPVARKLEVTLAAFSRQVRAERQRDMVATQLTDFFAA